MSVPASPANALPATLPGDASDLAEDVFVLPVSFAQERLWLIDQLMPDSPAYNLSNAIHIQGALHVAALERCLNEIVRRHEVLRTTFEATDGQPAQVIVPPRPLALPVTDLRVLYPEASRTERIAESLRLAVAAAQRPFDLTCGPLLRVMLLRLDTAEHVLLLTVHHIICDGWSTGVFLREVAALYQAFVAGRPSPLPELPLQYGDYAIWQRSWLAPDSPGSVLEQQLAYWSQRLVGAPPLLELPTDRPRPAVQSPRGGTHAFELSADVTAGLKALSHCEDATLFMTLLAAFNILLARYSGQTDILVGTPIANRNRVEVEQLIGFFVNTLVLRTDLSGNPPFRTLLRQVRERCLEAYVHQDLPFEKIVEEVQPERHLSRTPLFQVMFALQNALGGTLELPGLTFNPIESLTGAASQQLDQLQSRFDLSLILSETGSALHGQLKYSADLFEPATIARMQQQFQTLLAAIIADPSRSIQDLPLLTSAEQQQLVRWGAPGHSYPVTASLPALFAAHAARQPAAVALVYDEQSLSYGDLEQRANQLAHALRSHGVGPETIIAVYLERSLDLVVALLAVLKAGAAYLPLDPVYPAQRIQLMLEDAQAALVLTQQALAANVAALPTPLLRIDADWSTIAEQPSHPLASQPLPDQLAYVIYTSGSTGRPKGVQVTHAQVARLLSATQAWFGFGPDDVWTLFHSYAFDFSVWEIWGALCFGGRLVVVPYWVSRAPDAFYALLQSEAVTVLNQTPSAFQQLIQVDQGRAEQPPLALRYVIFGGEALNLQSLQPWFARYGDQRPQLINMYGITETTVHVTYRPLRQADLKAAPGSMIGQPIPDLTCYILDAQLRPVPISVPGELYVGGAGVVRGYLNRPALTAERFIPNPFADGARLYKTGDRARYVRDGDIEYLGRIDQQIKLRGFRIELGEIAAVLQQHPQIRDVVVTMQMRGADDKQLVAYIVTEGLPAPTARDLRQHLLLRLPDYMVPSAFVELSALPVTANGKIDQQALPQPHQADALVADGFVAPRTPTEELLATIWTRVLGIERVGVFDNFFELGGHSLLATQVLARMRDVFPVELRLRALFDAPTIAEIALQIERACDVGTASTYPPLLPMPRAGDPVASFPQRLMWWRDQIAPGDVCNIVQLAFHLDGALDLAALTQSVNAVVERHEILRTTFALRDDVLVQVIAPTLTLAVPLVDLRAYPDAERAALTQHTIEQDGRQPFDLTAGPLLRCQVLQLADEAYTLLLAAHHSIFDGWSTSVLLTELLTFYISSGMDLSDPLPVQYADFALWQHALMQSPALEPQLAYWRHQLRGPLPMLTLPGSAHRPSVQTGPGASVPIIIPADLAQSLSALSARTGVTLFVTLLAAFKTMLFHASGQDDIIVGTQIAGRTQAATERLIGCFINVLALRTDLSGSPSFAELLLRLREVTLDAYTHQDVPLELLITELQLDRDLKHESLFQALFTLHTEAALSLAVDVPGFSVRPLETASQRSGFDLNLALWQTGTEISGFLEYRTDLFAPAMISELSAMFQTVLRCLVDDVDQSITTLRLA